MDAALTTAIGVIGSAVVAGGAAVYGSKIAGRAQQEGTALTGYDNLTLYDGSMGEWAKDKSLPIETG